MVKPLTPKKAQSVNSAFNSAVWRLSRTTLSENELRQRLLRRGFIPEVIEQALQRCYEYNYLNDLQAAEVKLRSFQRKHYSGKVLIQKLQQAGFSQETISTVLETETSADTKSAVYEAMDRKIRGKSIPELDEIQKRRLKGWLLRRGFTYQEIQEVFAEYG